MRYTLILVFFILSQQGLAQFPDYYVYLVYGRATYEKPGKKPAALVQKQCIFKNDIIVLKKGAKITLVDRDTNFFILNTPCVNKAGELTALFKKRKVDGITSKYLKLLFHELFDPNGDPEKFNEKNLVKVKGTVFREVPDYSKFPGNKIFPENGLKSSTGSITFRWHKTSPVSQYSLVIYSEKNDSAVIAVKDTQRRVDIKETLHGDPGKYYWTVKSKDDTSENETPVLFEILTPAEERKDIKKILTFAGKESLKTQLQQIDKLEDDGFIDAASARFAAVVKANPDNEALRKSYVLFLLSYGFEKEPASR